jgi:hypothetical protein
MSNQKDYSEDDFEKMGIGQFFPKFKDISTDANVSIRDIILPMYQIMGNIEGNNIATGLILLYENVEELRESSALIPGYKFTVSKLLKNSPLSDFCIKECAKILLKVSPEWGLEALENSSEYPHIEYTFSSKSEDELRGILELRHQSSKTPLFKTSEINLIQNITLENRDKSREIRVYIEEWDIRIHETL